MQAFADRAAISETLQTRCASTAVLLLKPLLALVFVAGLGACSINPLLYTPCVSLAGLRPSTAAQGKAGGARERRQVLSSTSTRCASCAETLKGLSHSRKSPGATLHYCLLELAAGMSAMCCTSCEPMCEGEPNRPVYLSILCAQPRALIANTIPQVFADCDRDSIIYLADPIGPSCHTGARLVVGESMSNHRKIHNYA